MRWMQWSLLIASIYLAAMIGLCRPDPLQFCAFLFRYAVSLTSVWLVIGASLFLARLRTANRREGASSALALLERMARARWRQDRCLGMVAPLVGFVFVLCGYSLFKIMCLPSAGFWFGHHAAQADRMIFGGDAWHLTHAVLRSPWQTQAIDLLYHGGFLPLVVGIALCSFAPAGSPIAARYLTSYVLLWVVQGTVIAYLLPAAGPALHQQMHPDVGRFGELVRVLREQDGFLRAHGAPGLYSAQYQRALIGLFRAPELAIGGGISAMPSLHNAMAVLFALAAGAIARPLGVAAWTFAAVIWIGSVHLGWHFAVDGMAAFVLTLATWWVVGWAMRANASDVPAPVPVAADALGPVLAGAL